MISEAELRETAAIARIPLKDDEIGSLQEQFQKMIDYFAMLDLPAEMDAGKEVVARTAELAECRLDEVCLKKDRSATTVAPDFSEEFFFVPRVL